MQMSKTFAIVVGTSVLLAAGMPFAQTTNAPGSTPSPTATQSGSAMSMGGQMGQMDEHTQMMKALHEKLKSATTPEARKIVMDKQREEMHESMATMEQMGQGGGMMGQGGGMMGQGGGMKGNVGGGMMDQKGKPADATTQMQMMQKRMDMMQMMMQTMMDQQGMMVGPKVADAAPRK
jgi:hypothetical protein